MTSAPGVREASISRSHAPISVFRDDERDCYSLQSFLQNSSGEDGEN